MGDNTDPLREVFFMSLLATWYDVEVTDFTVTSALNDGIFEPNIQILVSS